MRSGRGSWWLAVLGAAMLAPAVAAAGTVGDVVDGLERAQGKMGGSSGGRGGGAAGDFSIDLDGRPSQSTSANDRRSSVYQTARNQTLRQQRDVPSLSEAERAALREQQLALVEKRLRAPTVVASLRMQRVAGAAFATGAELQVNTGDLALGARYCGYFDEPDSLGDRARLDVWGVSAGGRILEAAPLRLVVEGGLAGAHGGDASLVGVQAGLQAERRLVGKFSLQAVARLFYLRDGVFADEAALTLAAGPWRLGYRVLDFNTGPALHGPEIALAFLF